MIKCPTCGEIDSICFEGTAILPVGFDSEEDLHFWDWDNGEMIDERGYFCRECNEQHLEPDEFVIKDGV